MVEGTIINSKGLVTKSYVNSFKRGVGAIMLGLTVSDILNTYHPLNECAISLFQAFSVLPAMTALGARNDFSTWGGRSSVEILNQDLCHLFSFLGLLLPVIAFRLHA